VHKKSFAFVLLASISIPIVALFYNCNMKPKTVAEWKAPADMQKLRMPFDNPAVAAEKGKELYNLYCWNCHGKTGNGDGAAGQSLGRKPGNFHSQKVKSQTDGSLFWKINTGNANMPPFKEVLSDEESWQLVAYIRHLSGDERVITVPKALRPDITISHFMEVGPQAVRILSNEITHDLYYTTFDGDVFRIRKHDKKRPDSIKLLTVKDHGINRLQGAVFYENALFLTGNVDQNNKVGTSGRMVRYNMDSAGDLDKYDSIFAKTATVIFNTVVYGANKTIYDHGWNALEISPDGKYIFVNSGARTDHGEVQDNGGAYPNMRDNALTGKIFRFPIDSRDLFLEDDEAKLKAAGFIYAEGIRNAYDMAFDADGNLFAVVNSGDYDHPEDMFWVREGHHYGFPWIMGGIENPQQFPEWKPDPEKDHFINKTSHSWRVRYFQNDPVFPKIPATIKFSPGVQNLGPDANEYRGHSGQILDGDQTGVHVSTFTPHCSPLGIFFDKEKKLGLDLAGDGFVIRYTLGSRSSLMRPFTLEGADLLHLEFTYDKTVENYYVSTNRIVEGFTEPTDAVLVKNELYIIEYGEQQGHIWKILLPGKTIPAKSKSVRKRV
jgi:mono/diheme cytochrome c family protein